MEAARDLRTACKIDFDDTADEWLKEVTPNVSDKKAPRARVVFPDLSFYLFPVL